MNSNSLLNHYRWDIFCTVIDNFGDIGICWRLARQLANEHGQQVRLWVDDLASFQRICPEINPLLLQQQARGVDIRFWSKPLPALLVDDIPDIVIEAFACDIPEDYVALMAQRSKAPLWLNMEYLSAEEWILGCHGLSSPHPRYPLQKTFFFPGFVAGTGGLLRERNLLAERDTFLNSKAAQTTFWHKLNVPTPAADELRISMFGYDNPVEELVALWSQSPTPITVCAAEGKLAQQFAVAMQKVSTGQPSTPTSQTRTLGQLTLHVLPFLEQDLYDRLLWACDINFVRGEDSFVRAQWAAKPFVWQIYRQDENTHLEKLDAFLSLYQQELPASSVQAVAQFWHAWNEGRDIAACWPAFLNERGNLALHHQHWITGLQQLGDFATNLMMHCQKNK